MKRKPIFNNPKVTRLMKRYVRHKNNLELRDRIVRLSLPLIDAAINKLSNKSMYSIYKHKEDIKQECALKVIQAVPKFNARRGDAFGFMWATICNMCKTINERMSRPSYSLSSDEAVQKEAELHGREVFQTPENQHILNSIGKSVSKSLATGGFRIPKQKLHRRACKLIRKHMETGEFFFDRSVVTKELKELGLDKKEIQFYCQYSLVVVRRKLLEARENSHALSNSKISKSVSVVADSGDSQGVWN
jgi:hypothetical protein